jgi:copper chaperone CopZ
MSAVTATARYHVTGMDCTSCAAKIETTALKIEGVADVKVSIASQIMTLEVDDPERRLPELEAAVEGLGYRLHRLTEPNSSSADEDDDDKIPDLSHVTPGYKRPLWIVVLLNVGYGLIVLKKSVLLPR